MEANARAAALAFAFGAPEEKEMMALRLALKKLPVKTRVYLPGITPDY
jgi:ribosomal protein L16/L10AE